MRAVRALALTLSLSTAGLCASAWAGPPEASESVGPLEIDQTLSPNPSHIGDALELQLEVRYPKGYRVNLPTGLTMGKAEVTSVEEGSPRRTDGGSVKTFRIHLQAFEDEDFSLPPVMLTYTDPDGQVATADAPAMAVEVERLTANEAEAERKGEDPPVSLEYPNVLAERVFWAALAALLLGVALGIAWLTVRRKKPRAAPVIIRAPHELALEALRDLESRRLDMLEGGAYQDFYLELTAIAKQYVQARFGVEVVERTTDELHLMLRRERHRLTGLEPEELLSFLREADLIKFARLAPTAAETQEALASVERIVLQPRPVTTPARDTNAGPSRDGGGAGASRPEPPEPPEPPRPTPPDSPLDPPPGPAPEPPPGPAPEPPPDPTPGPPPEGGPPRQRSGPPPSERREGPAGPTAPDMRPGPKANPFPKADREDVA